MKLKYLALPFFALILSLSTMVALPQQAKAVSAADWKAGRIIDDAVFFNKDSMSVQQIQDFLNAKVPVCDTYHNWSGWSYGYWNAPPFTCLKDFSENGKSSAQIIWESGQAYNINPQVLLVLLQKETAIVTDPWAATWQYKRATGYKCPDSLLGTDVDANQNGCYDSHENFTAQVNGAAFRFRDYVNYPNFYNFQAGVTRNILWSDKNCGSSPVYIENAATAALYNYTPYQPNQAALNNMYGTGDGCSAYGNRNFWRLFNDWFGSGSVFNGSIQLSGDYATSVGSQAVAGTTIYAEYSVTNNAPYPVFVGGLGICARNNGINNDFGFENSVTIPAYSTVKISKSRLITNPGILKIFVCSYNENLGGWASDFYPYNYANYPKSSITEIITNPVVNSAISFSPSNPTLGQQVTAIFTVQNNSSNPVMIPAIGVAVRDSQGNNVGFPSDINVTIQPNSVYTYSKSRTFTSNPGNFKYWITSLRNNTWDDNYPVTFGGYSRGGSLYIFDNPVVNSAISFSPSNPTLGQQVTAIFTVQNNSSNPVMIPAIGVAVRDSQGNNVGFPSDINVTIQPNSVYTYSKSRTFTSNPGNFKYWITSLRNNTWDDNYPVTFGGYSRGGTITVR